MSTVAEEVFDVGPNQIVELNEELIVPPLIDYCLLCVGTPGGHPETVLFTIGSNCTEGIFKRVPVPDVPQELVAKLR
jgi:hypothetical protein